MKLRERLERWFQSRLPLRDSVTLTQRTVYILPTPPGWAMALTLLVLLIASINYQLNLGYVLTFLLTGCAVVGMHVCHGTLRGLHLAIAPPEPQFAGGSVGLAVQLDSQRKQPRYAIGLAVWGTEQWSFCNVPAQGHSVVHVRFNAAKRGMHRVPTLTAETRFPLGTFRVWTVWRPAAQIMVYPAPESHPPPLPAGEPRVGGAATVQRQHTGEYDGVRAYRRGDALKLVVWKKVAKADELVSRDAEQVQRYALWLDLRQTSMTPGATSLEQRLSRLCAWILQAEEQGLHYGVRLPGVEIPPGAGDIHRKACLQALATYGTA